MRLWLESLQEVKTPGTGTSASCVADRSHSLNTGWGRKKGNRCLRANGTYSLKQIYTQTSIICQWIYLSTFIIAMLKDVLATTPRVPLIRLKPPVMLGLNFGKKQVIESLEDTFPGRINSFRSSGYGEMDGVSQGETSVTQRISKGWHPKGVCVVDPFMCRNLHLTTWLVCGLQL